MEVITKFNDNETTDVILQKIPFNQRFKLILGCLIANKIKIHCENRFTRTK